MTVSKRTNKAAPRRDIALNQGHLNGRVTPYSSVGIVTAILWDKVRLQRYQELESRG